MFGLDLVSSLWPHLSSNHRLCRPTHLPVSSWASEGSRGSLNPSTESSTLPFYVCVGGAQSLPRQTRKLSLILGENYGFKLGPRDISQGPHPAPFPLTNRQTPTMGLSLSLGLQRAERGREQGGRSLPAGNQLCHMMAVSKWPPVWASASPTAEQGKQNHSQDCLVRVTTSITISGQPQSSPYHHPLTIGVA